eukprot:PhM_4_TR2960/c0_g2_i1/m.58694
MSGHHHCGAPGSTQNQGNTLGDRPCVRQSRLYRQHEGGNAMKDLLGHGELKWDTNAQEGAYAGRRVHDPLNDMPTNQQASYQEQPVKQQRQPQAQPQEQQQRQGNNRRGTANIQSYNLFTGENY